MSAREEALRLVREGHDLHYAEDAADADLALLDGDRLYAAGLEALAAEGDLEAIRALADLISDCARAAAEEPAKRGMSADSVRRTPPGAASEAWASTAARLGVTGFTPS